MIIVRLMGGLGNQMFQYAMARRLAYRHNTKLKMDVFHLPYLGCTRREYNLNNFNILGEIASSKEIPFDLKPQKGKMTQLTNSIKKCILPPQLIMPVEETSFSFNSSYLNLPENVYLIGYFQSEKYFMDIRSVLLKEFTLKNRFPKELQKIYKIIQNTSSVSIHIRRGDFLTNPEVKQIYDVCPLSYYEKSVRYIEEHVDNPSFFIFSDEIDWAKNNMKLSHPTVFVSGNYSDKCWLDMHLMQSCKHHIIANSTFSWWAAVYM